MNFPFKLPDRYEFSGERLEGGQAFVYLCTDTYLQRPVAIKVMKHLSDLATLRQEIAALSEVKSRHVAEMYDLLMANRSGMLGLVEEFVPGKALSEHELAGGTAELLRILWQIACGISDIHAHGKIHRDIKPGNVRFDAEGVLKILDFGLAMDRADAETVLARGTRHFLAPELFRTPPIPVTQAVDVYGFGVTAWYLAHRGRLAAAMRELPPGSKTQMPSFATVLGLPSGLAALLDRTIALDPAARPDIAQVKTALERQLLYDKHRAFISYGAQSRRLSVNGESVILNAGQDGLTVLYDGLRFVIREVRWTGPRF